ncbi:MAG: DUF1851 domain-containing protein [Rhodospirillales bacterium]|nr:MAG: DUF1851 domain-containing protein [Rhodospirillales bacterium]
MMRADAIEKWNEVLAGAFPDFQGRICAFGYDWMGTCFALDKNRTEGGESLVVLFEVDTAEALEVPADFASFHNETLIEQREAALTPSFFDAWISAGGAAPRPDQCVGYKVPLFLGGQDTVENLELTDLAVYWEISSQLIAETRNLPPGTPVKGVSVD